MIVIMVMWSVTGLQPAAFAATQPPELREEREQAAVESVYRRYTDGDLAGAAQGYASLARAGNRVAQFNLAVMRVRGETTAISASEAFALLRQSARQGFVQAMRALAQAYEEGALGPRNLATSTYWYERAAKAGDPDAALSAGTAYFLGRGAPRDYVKAARYFFQAAQAGDAGAQYLYASMAEAGDGIARDLRIARYWYDAAAKSGEAGAAIKVKELDEKLSSE